MKIRRTITGISLLVSSALWGRVVEAVTGYTELMGWIAVTSVIAFMGGMLFYSGVSD